MVEDNQSSNWAEYVRKIKHEKVTLPWDAKSVAPPKRMSVYDKTRQERQFNPLLQKFRDDRIETTRKQAESAYRTEVLNRSRAREVKYGQPYNILRPTAVKRPTFEATQSLVASLPAPMQTKIKEQNHMKRMRASRVDYNILSNMSTQEHHYAPPGQRPEPLPPPRHGSGPGQPTVISSAIMKRDYNLISGKYKNHHSKRVQLDNKHLAETAAERFWQTHDFNPVTVGFYDGDKEELFKEARGVFEQSHGAVQRKRLPPKVRDSEGYLYDIVSMRTKDKEGLRTLEMTQTGGGSTLNKSAVEEKIRQKQNARYDLVEQRKMNRVAAKRFDDMTKHGYDLVTGQTFKGKGAKVVPRPVHMNPQPTVWGRASRVSGATNSAQGNHVGSSSRRGGEISQISQRSASATPVLRPSEPPVSSARSGRNTMSSMDFNDTMRGPETGSTARGSARSSNGGRSAQFGSAAHQVLAKDDSKGLVPKIDLTRTQNSSRVRTGGF